LARSRSTKWAIPAYLL